MFIQEAGINIILHTMSVFYQNIYCKKKFQLKKVILNKWLVFQ